MSADRTKQLGRWGEALAADELRRQGYRIVASGWHCRFGEIDLVAENESYLVFVEVKLRKNAQYGQAREFVNRRKQERVRITAQLYLAEHQTELQPRFDVMEVYAPNGTDTVRPQIQHIENAF